MLGGLPSGWRNVGGPPQAVAYAVGDRTLEVTYAFRRPSLTRSGFDVAVDGEPLDVALLAASPEQVTLAVEGVRRTYRASTSRRRVDLRGRTRRVQRVRRRPPLRRPQRRRPRGVAAGSHARARSCGSWRTPATPSRPGAALVVLEAMKMEHTVAAPVDGVVTRVDVAPGDQVETRQVLAVVEEPEEAAS